MGKEKAKGKLRLWMEVVLLVVFRMTSPMEKEELSGLMVPLMKENLGMVRPMVREFILIEKVQNMKAIGRMMSSMAKERRLGLMAQFILVILPKER